MNKQDLAKKIWEAANKMRSTIEASEYKDYILGFIFYKFLCETQMENVRIENDGLDEYTISVLTEEDPDGIGDFLKEKYGYYIPYDHLFSTWIEKGQDFDISNVRDALSSFDRHIHPYRREVFEKIFDTLQTGLSKLGGDAKSQSRAVHDIIDLIKDIPIDKQSDFDALGYIYEYLIEQFASNAGKKAGEFYTPAEVSQLMSEIVAHHVIERKNTQGQFEIYDPTSGSASLLLHIGKAIAKRSGKPEEIQYYAQELKLNTYNLTRMNLVMRGISPHNIHTKNADTLKDDWPLDTKLNNLKPLRVDAVVSNPPYSQTWDPAEHDIRFEYGIAPKSKADYAFLLHDLYHLKSSGIMTIVLPHGVLFRTGEEGVIRKNLIEHNHIQAIIGLPANIFFGTGIPTIIMVLRKDRSERGVLIVDASKYFVKEGKSNKLQASDIKRIVDVVTTNKEVEKFSRMVSLEEIRDNDYNLNIPRYVDSSEAPQSFDLYASLFGGVPKAEVDAQHAYWDVWPSLKQELYHETNEYCYQPTSNALAKTVHANADVQAFIARYTQALAPFKSYARERLIDHYEAVNLHVEEDIIAEYVEQLIAGTPLVNTYDVYQKIDDAWRKISADLETLKGDPRGALKALKDPDLQMLPYELIQQEHLTDAVERIDTLKNSQDQAYSELGELLSTFEQDELDAPLFSESGDAFNKKEAAAYVKELLSGYTTPELEALESYLQLLDAKAAKEEKLAFIAAHHEVAWNQMPANGDGTYAKTKVNAYIKELRASATFDPDTFDGKLVSAAQIFDRIAQIDSALKTERNDLKTKTDEKIAELEPDECWDLLALKWIDPLCEELLALATEEVNACIATLKALNEKYASTYADVCSEIEETEQQFVGMLDELAGTHADMAALEELKRLLGSL